MPRKSRLPSVHTKGYNALKAQRLAEEKLPQKTRCDDCNRLRSIANFSKKQLDNLRNGIATGIVKDPEGKWILCHDCTGTQRSEMQCCICGQWKGLDGFAKAQRRNGDDARCLECVSDHLMTPVMRGKNAVEDLLHELSEDSEDNDSDETGSIYTNPYGASNAGSTESGVSLGLRNLSITQGNEHNSEANGSSIAPGSNASASSRTSRQTASIISKWHTVAESHGAPHGRPQGGQVFTGYDSHGQAHNRRRSDSSAESEISYADTVKSARAEKKTHSAFAKASETGPRGVAHIPPPRYHTGRTVEYDSASEPEYDFGNGRSG